MSIDVAQTLSGESETCLAPRCWRDMESLQPVTLVEDEKGFMLDGPFFRLFKPRRSFQFWLEEARIYWRKTPCI
jgi:hypothetical protein